VLNVGCGAETDFLEMLRQEGAILVSQDIVLDVLLPLASLGGLAVCSALRNLPLKSGTFDVVMVFGAIHHVWPIDVPLSQMCRVLKPGGALFIHEPSAGSLPNRVKDLLPSPIRKLIWRMVVRRLVSSPYEKSFRPSQVINCLRQKDQFQEIRVSFPPPYVRSLRIGPLLKLVWKLVPSLSTEFDVYARKSGGMN